ncbi:hypothetical protein [Paenibacillus sp. NEAU-GSW1]|uniref:hypothetical protein n=1 Tax=Paenibacillus sp. NEAU-GSW1 TaxID=2682486 RepID=UPI0012E24018|nr:hypothetical protein [Paenibacillus sp. NEAU-GSW1]MUT66032.1 hypothetical protein [Paenibacillus sp. NEAU-GSW1]
MKNHLVFANKGFISAPMSALEAYRYSYNLKLLGNENVMVLSERDLAGYHAWKGV